MKDLTLVDTLTLNVCKNWNTQLENEIRDWDMHSVKALARKVKDEDDMFSIEFCVIETGETFLRAIRDGLVESKEVEYISLCGNIYIINYED